MESYGADTQWQARRRMMGWALGFGLLNAVAILVLLLRYVRFMGAPETVFAGIYLWLALIGHAFALTFVPALVLLLPLILVWPRRWLVQATGIFAGVVGIGLLLFDQVVYAQYRFHLNAVVFELIIGGGRELFEFSRATWLMATGAVAAALLFQVFCAWAAWRMWSTVRRRLFGCLALVLVLAAIAATHLIHAWADAAYYRPVTALTRHLPLYYPLTAKRFLQKHGFIDLARQRRQRKLHLKSASRAKMRYPLASLDCAGADNKLNLLIVVIDSWRFDMLTADITPNIHRFISKNPSWEFTSHISGGNGTRIGIFSLFYGLYGSHWETMAEEQIGPVFIGELLRQGYQPGIFASAKLTTPPFDRTVFRDISPLRSFSKGKSAWQRDRSALEDWMEWMDARDGSQPFFSFLFFDAIHTYSIPPDYPVVFQPMWEQVDYLALDNDFNPVPFVNRYKVATHYIDSLGGEILTYLDRRGLVKDTVILFTGDHGQEFNENGRNFWGHGGNYTRYQVQVPLVIYWPGRGAGVYQYRTSHFDIAATLMTDLLGCTNPPSDYCDGRHLLDINAPDWLILGGYFNRAIWEPDRITTSFPTGNYEIYDPTYGVIKDARLNFAAVKGALDEVARFYE